MDSKIVPNNALAIHFTEEDLNTYQFLTLQVSALEGAISNAADLEETDSLKSLRVFATMIQANFTAFREDLEDRMEEAKPINRPALNVISRIRPETTN